MDHVGNSWFRMTPAVIPMRSAGMSNMTRSKSIRDLLAVGCFRLMLYKIDTSEPLAITAAEGDQKVSETRGRTGSRKLSFRNWKQGEAALLVMAGDSKGSKVKQLHIEWTQLAQIGLR